MYVFMGDFSTNFRHKKKIKKKKKKKLLCTFVCVPLGLKKPGTSQCPKVTGTH